MTASQAWLVEIKVESPGSDAGLWSDFVAKAKVYEGPGFKWSTPALRFTGDEVVISAIVVAETPESAIRRASTVVRNVGRLVDRYDRVSWARLVATATFYQSGP